MTFIYFHGYASSGTSNTAKLLKEYYPNIAVISPTYNTRNAHSAMETLENIVARYASQEVVLIGTSLGGFFANYFSNKYGLPAVLINPCLDPQKLLQKYNPKDCVDCLSFLSYYSEDSRSVPKTVVLGKKDDVIPYEMFLERLSKYHVFIKENMQHRVSDISEVKEAVDQILNNSYL